MRLNFAKYIGGMRSYMPSPAFGSRYALGTVHIVTAKYSGGTCDEPVEEKHVYYN